MSVALRIRRIQVFPLTIPMRFRFEHAAAGREIADPVVLRVEGGWSAVVQVPQIRSEESLVLDLLDKDDVLVHPGYFFDFPREAYLVVSLLVEPGAFDHAIARVVSRAAGAPS